MACVNPTFWRQRPVGSQFAIKASGDGKLFNVSVGVNVNGKPEDVWKHDDIVKGKKRTLAAGEKCTFHVLVNIFSEPPDGTSVDVEAHVEAPDDGTPDPTRKCSSSFTNAGNFPLTFFFSV